MTRRLFQVLAEMPVYRSSSSTVRYSPALMCASKDRGDTESNTAERCLRLAE